jgi:hypothetical protein
MPHTIEAATSARAKCRGCDRKIDKDELRFGERQANIFGDGEMTLWFHLQCAAFKRPEPLLEALSEHELYDAAALAAAARFGVEHRRVPRIDGADRAPTGRAKCRHCHELIPKDSWRIELVFFEEFRFAPSGFIHAACAAEYFETVDILDRLRYFSPALDDAALQTLAAAIRRGP